MTTMIICCECWDRETDGVEYEERCLGHLGLHRCDECGKEVHLWGLGKRHDMYHQPSENTWKRAKERQHAQ